MRKKKQSTFKKWWVWVIIVVVVYLIIGFIINSIPNATPSTPLAIVFYPIYLHNLFETQTMEQFISNCESSEGNLIERETRCEVSPCSNIFLCDCSIEGRTSTESEIFYFNKNKPFRGCGFTY